MGLSGLFEAYVYVNGIPLTEHDDPGEDTLEENTTTCYVLAEAGQQFEVHCRILPGFQLLRASYIAVKLELDDSDVHWVRAFLDKTISHTKGTLTQSISHCFQSTSAKGEDGEWKNVTYRFGALGLCDDAPIEAGLTEEKLGKLGRIKVIIYRACQSPLLTPFLHDYPFDNRDEIPERMMKGREIKSNVKFVAAGPSILPPSPTLYHYMPVQGPNGQITTFYFKYRNKKTLQNVGCIPRSPSSEPDHALIAARTEEMLQLEKQARRRETLENLRLKQEIERLRGGSRESTVTLVDDGSTASRGVKRERDEQEDDLKELAPPPKRAPVVIDLLDDD